MIFLVLHLQNRSFIPGKENKETFNNEIINKQIKG